MAAKNGEVPPAALKVLQLTFFFAFPTIAAALLIFPLSYFQIGYESNGDPLFVARGRVVKEGFSSARHPRTMIRKQNSH